MTVPVYTKGGEGRRPKRESNGAVSRRPINGSRPIVWVFTVQVSFFLPVDHDNRKRILGPLERVLEGHLKEIV